GVTVKIRYYFYLRWPRFFRYVEFYLAGVDIRYRDFFVLPGQSEESVGFIAKIRPLDSGNSRFDCGRCDAILSVASSSAFPPPHYQSSYNGSPSEVGCACKHLIGFLGCSPYLWGCSRGNSLYFHLAYCGRLLPSIGMFIFSDVRR